MRLVQVACPKCGQPVPAEANKGDTVLLCTCGTAHTRNGEVRVVDYEVAAPNRSAPGTLAYLPFWRVLGYVRIFWRKVEGGTLWKLAALFTGQTRPNEGWVNVFVPATPLDPETFKAWATGLTNRPPVYRRAEGFAGGTRMPTLVTMDVAARLADFILLSNEAEQPGVLQDLQYTFEPREFHLHYLPFAWDGRQYTPAL